MTKETSDIGRRRQARTQPDAPSRTSKRVDSGPQASRRSRSNPTLAAQDMLRVLRSAQPDSDADAFLRIYNRLSSPPAANYPLAEARREWQLLAQALGRRAAVGRVTTMTIDGPSGGIELRIFRPDSSASLLPGLLWVHGGGFILGGLETSESICRSISRDANVAVVAVRYRLAPEHDLRVGRDDCLAALRWLASEGGSIGIDTQRLAVGGDSAGGNISAALAQACRAGDGPELRMQLLVYPATDLERNFPSRQENASGYLLTSDSIEWMRQTIASTLDLSDPWLSPARSTQLRGLAPALIITAGFDPIRDDGLHYAASLRAAGVPVDLLHYAGQFHGFLNCDAVLGAARDAQRRIALALGSALRDGGSADRTLEIAEHPTRPRAPFRKAMMNSTRTSLMAWESAAQLNWSLTLLHQAAPRLARLSMRMLEPLLSVGVSWPRTLSSLLYGRSVRQTYPPPSPVSESTSRGLRPWPAR